MGRTGAGELRFVGDRARDRRCFAVGVDILPREVLLPAEEVPSSSSLMGPWSRERDVEEEKKPDM